MFSIAVFGPIVNEGYVNADSGPELRCVFNGNAGACRFGVALGLGAFFACAAFLLLDVRFQQISSVRDRRRAVLLDLGFSGRRGSEGQGLGERAGLLGWAESGGRASGRGQRERVDSQPIGAGTGPGGAGVGGTGRVLGLRILLPGRAGPGVSVQHPLTRPPTCPQGSGPSCGSWAFVSSPTSGSARRPGRARRRRQTRRGPPLPSASFPSSAG